MPQCRIFLINGFLGSGKTTLIKALLEELGEYKVGLLENEFGEIGIDGSLFSQTDLKLVEVDNGSIFCSCRSDQFLEGLTELAKYNLDILFIESSGISDPAPMERDLQIVAKQIGDVYSFEGNICVVDSINFPTTLEVLEAVRRQVEYSNLVLLNKVDLIGTAERETLKNQLHDINAQVHIVETLHCKITFQDIVHTMHPDVLPDPADSYNTPLKKPQKILLETTMVLAKDKLCVFLSHFASQTFRLKGYCRLFEQTQDESEWYYVDAVQNSPGITKTDYQPRKTKLVVILEQGNPLGEIIQDAWKKLVA